MSTIADIATWATNKLKRTDVSTEAREAALNFYKLLCARVPFDALQETSTLQVLATGGTFDLATLSPKVRAIDNVRVVDAGGTGRRLHRRNRRWYDAIPVHRNGTPSSYIRWKDTLIFEPGPTTGQKLQVSYWARPTLAAPDPYVTTLVIPEEWDELMRWETLYRLYMLLEMQNQALMLVSPAMAPPGFDTTKRPMKDYGIIPRLWNELLRTVSQMEHTDEDFSINPGRA